MQTQAIIHKSFTTTYTFAGVPSQATREKLKAAGFQFDSKTKQWYRNERQSDITSETDVAIALAA
jgi:hypothetical protein